MEIPLENKALKTMKTQSIENTEHSIYMGR